MINLFLNLLEISEYLTFATRLLIGIELFIHHLIPICLSPVSRLFSWCRWLIPFFQKNVIHWGGFSNFFILIFWLIILIWMFIYAHILSLDFAMHGGYWFFLFNERTWKATQTKMFCIWSFYIGLQRKTYFHE